METLAQKVKKTIEDQCPNTFSLYAGYGVANGLSIRFTTGVQLNEKRNDKGRVIKALYQYADDSKLEYKYNSNSENYTLTVK